MAESFLVRAIVLLRGERAFPVLLAFSAMAFFLVGNQFLVYVSLITLGIFASLKYLYKESYDLAISAKLEPLKKFLPIKDEYLYALLAGSVVLYFLGMPYFVLISVLALLLKDFFASVLANGFRNEVFSYATTIGYVLVLWAVLSFLLFTRSPVNAIISCSMLPNMQRGDMILLAGTDAGALAAPTLTLTQEEFNRINLNHTILSQITGGSGVIAEVGIGRQTYFSYCNGRPTDPFCNISAFDNGIIESNGPLSMHIDKCYRKIKGATYLVPCVAKLEVSTGAGTSIFHPNYSNSVIVYNPNAGDAFMEGDVIHRVYLKIRVVGQGMDTKPTFYYLTKGDNNPLFDFQFYDPASGKRNSIASEKQVVGRVVFTIPYVGYLRLLLTPAQYNEGCDSNLHYNLPG
ncbi:hypothetical protein COT30_02830 [Candidatus Micrarchaeota archaeon CG08_land_8_20_14_0_20_49_17]|nr:MAG: hypothetical protein COT30_02830 [Candidatus Micrarchaeota archaeon CG08_land_8_20_14_0_20_49_17]